MKNKENALEICEDLIKIHSVGQNFYTLEKVQQIKESLTTYKTKAMKRYTLILGTVEKTESNVDKVNYIDMIYLLDDYNEANIIANEYLLMGGNSFIVLDHNKTQEIEYSDRAVKKLIKLL